MKMNTEEKATYLMELFKVPLLNENKRLDYIKDLLKTDKNDYTFINIGSHFD
jgi:hypothetical protein